MNQFNARGIVLARTDYGEADRIITFLSPDHGKLKVMAKGVRKSKSKLAGGIELFSVSQLTIIKGRGEIDTLVSSRLEKHFGNIVKNIERTMFGYEVLKVLNKITADFPDSSYFSLAEEMLTRLDSPDVSLELLQAWFYMHLLRLGGRVPQLKNDVAGKSLQQDNKFEFDYEAMAFAVYPEGQYTAAHIKLLRVLASASAASLAKLEAKLEIIQTVLLLLRSIHAYGV